MPDTNSKVREAKHAPELTLPDLVLLSLLAERSMHGYQANAELERREVRDWAGISRPQVYYSLEKLLRSGLVRQIATSAGGQKNAGKSAGPERRVVATTARGRHALAAALERDDWCTVRERPPFLTWMALSWQTRPGVFAKQLARRREFLERELRREREVLRSVLREVGHPHHEAVWMLKLTILHIAGELRWLRAIEREAPKRARARFPEYSLPLEQFVIPSEARNPLLPCSPDQRMPIAAIMRPAAFPSRR